MDKRYSKGPSCGFAGWAFCWLLAVGESGIVERFFYTVTRIHPEPLARPLSRGLRDWGCHVLDLYGYGDPSCADGAALLQGPTGLGLSHIGFYTATGIHPALTARPLSRGLRDWGCHALDIIRLGGSILRRWRGPSPRAYGIGVVAHWILYG